MSQRPSLTRGLPLCEPEALPDPGPAPLPARRELSREPHPASSRQDEALVQLLLQRWQDPESGLDLAEASSYEVLLSFPSPEQPNQVAIGEVLPSPSPPPLPRLRGRELWGPRDTSGTASGMHRIPWLLTLPSPQWGPLGTSASPVARAKRT